MTFDLFAQEHELANFRELTWPAAGEFPLNIGEHHVENIIIPDLISGIEPLIVTGFTSLDRIIDFSYKIHTENPKARLKLVIGQEPFPSRKESYSIVDSEFTEDIEHYWLKRGISLVYSAKLIHLVTLLKKKRVLARYLPSHRRLHAKIYCGDNAATVGSSNFTEPGLRNQYEANTRFEKARHAARYQDLRLIAENYWTMSEDYNAQLIALLEKLLRVVSWKEALARACAELLEGEWAERYIRGEYLAGSGSLWPSQKQGIAQALTILSTQGSVLVADATGAGKTKMGTYLVGAIRDRVLRTGRLRQGKAIMVCPPAAESIWKKESNLSGVELDPYSHGVFSNEKAKHHEGTIDALRRAQILCIDEGHNFLSFKSQRTQKLLRNMADHVLLFTATPINRSASDLLRIADMLGADNLSESTVDAFKRMLGAGNLSRNLIPEEINELRAEIRRFTVRRTKKQLNRLIKKDPEAYINAEGKPCKFPKHGAKVYSLSESVRDREIAEEISELAGQLFGVTHFRKPIAMPDVFTKKGMTESEFMNGRLVSAKKLSAYLIRSSLRSSRAALIEHINGTSAATEFSGLDIFRKGNMSEGMIIQIKQFAGKLPENKLSIDLPDWLTTEEAHIEACNNDIAVYTKIASLVAKLSDSRESSKAKKLVQLLKAHDLLLAFDRKPITLAVIKDLITRISDSEIVTVWGGNRTQRDILIEKFALGSKEKGIIGLCSDSVAEAVNLQQASCLLHLDMPSVVRIAEQRVGRIDRMDSPHDRVDVWWPEDADEFALTSDEKFVERYDTVDKLIGSNMPLPDVLQSRASKVVKVQEFIAEVEEQENTWDGLDDAFSPVRELVEGERQLVSSHIYERYRFVTDKVLSRVSVVRSKSSWALFCITAGSFESPIWVFLPSINAPIETELSQIVKLLRSRLENDTEDIQFDERGANILNRFLQQLCFREKELLSKKKQRALSEMQVIIEKLLAIDKCNQYVDHLLSVHRMLTNPPGDKQPDWDEIASRWLDVIRPTWFNVLQSPRKKPLVLKDIRRHLLLEPRQLAAEIEAQFREFPILPKPDERIKACIIGLN